MSKLRWFLCIMVFQSVLLPQNVTGQNVMAVGGTLGWRVVSEGETIYTRLTPNIFAYSYFKVQDDLFFRPTVRLEFTLTDLEMPRSLSFQEDDYLWGVDFAMVYDWIVVPSLSAGVYAVYRKITFQSQDPILSSPSSLSETVFIPLVAVQLGLGFPIYKGIALAEPFVRYNHYVGDSRFPFNYGIEFSLAF